MFFSWISFWSSVKQNNFYECLCSIKEKGTREKDRTFENVCVKNFHINYVYNKYENIYINYTHTHTRFTETR